MKAKSQVPRRNNDKYYPVTVVQMYKPFSVVPMLPLHGLQDFTYAVLRSSECFLLQGVEFSFHVQFPLEVSQGSPDKLS